MQAQATLQVQHFKLSTLAAAIVSYLQTWIPISPFPLILNNKLFTDTDGERAVVVAFNYRFQNC